MKTNTLIFIISIVAAAFGLILISEQYKKAEIATAEKERKEKNILQVIIDSTKNKHPVFNESIKGKVIVVNVWTSWLPACRKQIPELNKLVKDFSSDKIVFIAIDPADSAREVTTLQKENIKFEYKLLFGEKDLSHIFYSEGRDVQIGEVPLPMNVVINSEGRVEMFYSGDHPEQLQNIRNYLSQVSGRR